MTRTRLVVATLIASTMSLCGVFAATSAEARAAATPGPACSTNAGAVTPVVCLPTGSGEDSPGHVVLGGSIGFAAQIVNNGPAVDGATLVFALPTQLRPDADEPVVRLDDWYDEDDLDEDGTELVCTPADGGATLSCETGALAANLNTLVVISLQSTESAQAGTSATFTTTLHPETAGAFPVTSVQATVEFLLPAKLSVTITPARTEVVIGRTKDLAVTVHNAGTGPAPDTFAVTVLTPDFDDDAETPHFAITNAPDLPIPGAGELARTTTSVGRGTTALFSARAADEDPLFAIWPVGTVEPGDDATFTVTVKARTRGTDVLFVAAVSDAVDPACDDASDESDEDADCLGQATARLTAVPAPAPPTPTPTPAPSTHSTATHAPAGAGDAVANTGVDNLTPELLLGLLAVLVGAGLTYAGRTTYRGRHSGHTS